MRNYATLFDKNYLVRGLCLHATLSEHSSEDFMLYILAMDHETYMILKALEGVKLSNVEIISIEDLLQDETIRTAKLNRTWQEFCWTMASVFCDRLLNRGSLTNLTYLDADKAVYSDPKQIHEELVGSSIGITPHRLLPARRELEVNGIYNVGWVSFKRSPIGYECLNEWARMCLAWCYNRHEYGWFGDQKYLDAWPQKYKCCCHIINHLGCNAAPWNISQYKVTGRDGNIYINEDKLVTYHFHEFKKKEDGTFYYTGWPLQFEVTELIYKPYCDLYMKIESELKELAPWLS
jgi:hypothetical protein